MEKSKEVYFYYTPKNPSKRMRIEFGFEHFNNYTFREEYFLKGIFLPEKIFEIPEKGYYKFNKSDIKNIKGEFFEFPSEDKINLEWFIDLGDVPAEENVQYS